MNFFGLQIGIATLFIIGLGFPLVIQTERRLGYLWWPYMLGIGFLLVTASLTIQTDWLCATTAILGATFVWGSTELKEQALRSELGWYPRNPASRKILPPFAENIKKWKAPHL